MSGFKGALDVQILDTERDGRITAKLIQPFGYVTRAGGTIEVPAGFVTDFASVPWGLWNLEPPLGDSCKAAVIHDRLYATRGLDGRYTRADADGIFREALADLGVPAWKRLLLWAAVRAGGAHGWGH
jgi:hypothetical protein